MGAPALEAARGLTALLSYGEALWWGAAAALVGLGLVLGRRMMRRGLGAAARLARRRFGPPRETVDGCDEDVLVAEGQLLAGAELGAPLAAGALAVSTPGLLGLAPARRARAARRLWVAIADACVELDGVPDIVCGSRDRVFGGRALYVGDRVLVRGFLRRRAGDDVPASFREPGSGRHLEPAYAVGAFRVELAFAGAPDLTGAWPLTSAAGALMGLGAWALVSFAAATLAPGPTADGELPALSALAVTSPLHGEALLARFSPARDATLPQRSTFAEVERTTRGTCAATRARAEESGQLEPVAALSGMCAGDYRDESAAALVRLGRFGDAHAVLAEAPTGAGDFEAARVRVDAHVLSGHVDDAIAEARAFAATAPAGGRAERMSCVAATLEHATRRDPQALEELRRRRFGAAGPVCTLLLASRLRGWQRDAVLERLSGDTAWANVAALLLVESDPSRVPSGPMTWPGVVGALAGATAHAPAHPGWVEGALYALERQPARPLSVQQLRASLAIELASFAQRTGDSEREARFVSQARDAIAAVEAADRSAAEWVDGARDALSLVAAAEALSSGRVSSARDALAEVELPSTSGVFDAHQRLTGLADFLEYGSTELLAREAHRRAFGASVVEGLGVASHGDGQALADWLDGRSPSETGAVATVGAFALTRDRSAVWRRLEGGESAFASVDSAIRLVDLGAFWHQRALAARALGERDQAARCAAIAERFRDALRPHAPGFGAALALELLNLD